MTSVIINQSWLIAVDVKSINFRDYKKSHDRITFRVSRGDERGRELGDHVVVLRTGRREDFKHFSGAHQRASRNGPSHDEVRPWWGVSRGLSGDFMYITIPEVGTRAVHCWLTGRRSRRSRVVCAARHTKWNGSHVCRREKSFSFSLVFSFFFLKRNIFHRAIGIEFTCVRRVRDAWKSHKVRASTEPVRQADRQTDRISTDQRSLRSRMIVLAWCLFVIVSFLVAKNQAFLNAPIPGTFYVKFRADEHGAIYLVTMSILSVEQRRDLVIGHASFFFPRGSFYITFSMNYYLCTEFYRTLSDKNCDEMINDPLCFWFSNIPTKAISCVGCSRSSSTGLFWVSTCTRD